MVVSCLRGLSVAWGLRYGINKRNVPSSRPAAREEEGVVRTSGQFHGISLVGPRATTSILVARPALKRAFSELQ